MLQVHPFAGMASYVSSSVPRMLFNKEVGGSFLHEPRPTDVVQTGAFDIITLFVLFVWSKLNISCNYILYDQEIGFRLWSIWGAS